ncbi:MAG: hypothetical protein LBQ24_06170 [Candidatus Peribacteria bacterium]|nr:hypothetical protein [Candidatus Peribacteria bacterium]
MLLTFSSVKFHIDTSPLLKSLALLIYQLRVEIIISFLFVLSPQSGRLSISFRTFHKSPSILTFFFFIVLVKLAKVFNHFHCFSIPPDGFIKSSAHLLYLVP